jgi:tetratricopeptide (TPR) repeat protein
MKTRFNCNLFSHRFNNLGNSLRFVGRVSEADKCFETALAQAPGYFNAIRNRGTLHAWTGRIDLAFQYYHEAMQLNPQDAELHRNLGVIHLLQGNFQEGWREYRHRWLCKEAISHPYIQPNGRDNRSRARPFFFTPSKAWGTQSTSCDLPRF